MKERTAKGMLLAAFTWIVILAVLAAAFKYFVYPHIKGQLASETGSESQYKHEISIAADSFSGYCVFRSDLFKRGLKADGIKLTIVDDEADYKARTKALKKGKVQMAVFPLDSLIKTGALIGEFPATIVMVVDETKGADAIVAYKDAVSSLQDLNDPEARIVITPDSPSEFLARIVIAHFAMPSLPEKWWINADGAADVYKMFKTADPEQKRAYALWEPYVSKALDVDGAHVLLDSSKLKGYIVDVLVARRAFLRDNPDLVRQTVETYLRAAFSYSRDQDAMSKLVRRDAKETGTERLDEAQAAKIIQGIQWKNTLENYAYFGLLSGQEARGFQHIEDVITNITDVLVKTGALSSDPLNGKPNTLFYDKILREMQAENFHPGKKLSILADVGLNIKDLAEVRTEKELGRLSDRQWDTLVTVGTMKVKPISFARGTARLNIQSQRELDELVEHLKSWPNYYLRVVGHARAEGDADANVALAGQRAEAAVRHLISRGVSENRIKATGARPAAGGASSQSVSFTLGQLPY